MKNKILVVDDDFGICDAFTMLLREEGYEVDSTMDSTEAVDFIKRYKYKVCLFDFKMPGLNGIDLLKMVKNINPPSSVFIVSGMLNIEELCKKEIKAGLISGVINKPFDIDGLLQKIASIYADNEVK